jgi:hypothetical protein
MSSRPALHDKEGMTRVFNEYPHSRRVRCSCAVRMGTGGQGASTATSGRGGSRARKADPTTSRHGAGYALTESIVHAESLWILRSRDQVPGNGDDIAAIHKLGLQLDAIDTGHENSSRGRLPRLIDARDLELSLTSG